MRFILLAAVVANSAYAAEPVKTPRVSDAETEWAELYRRSFSGGDDQDAEPAKGQDSGHELLLVTGSSLPVRLIFGAPASRWQENALPEALAEDRRASLSLTVEGCKLALHTGPVQIASYEMVAGQPAVVSDSLPTKSELRAAAGGSVYVSASAELTVEVPQGIKSTCQKRLQGRLVPLGRLSLDATTIGAVAPEGGPHADVAAVSLGLGQDVFLMWPLAVDAPVLLDAMGPHPQVETGVRRARTAAAGDFYLDVEPRIERVGDVRGGDQRAAGLRSIWGDSRR